MGHWSWGQTDLGLSSGCCWATLGPPCPPRDVSSLGPGQHHASPSLPVSGRPLLRRCPLRSALLSPWGPFLPRACFSPGHPGHFGMQVVPAHLGGRPPTQDPCCLPCGLRGPLESCSASSGLHWARRWALGTSAARLFGQGLGSLGPAGVTRTHHPPACVQVASALASGRPPLNPTSDGPSPPVLLTQAMWTPAPSCHLEPCPIPAARVLAPAMGPREPPAPRSST